MAWWLTLKSPLVFGLVHDMMHNVQKLFLHLVDPSDGLNHVDILAYTLLVVKHLNAASVMLNRDFLRAFNSIWFFASFDLSTLRFVNKSFSVFICKRA